mmetsp:Transcript_1934/g.2953  ORF Transcript_1934/g.2953 Transcript_1934/m.2953 type:complete len:149 (-) Transcript_1934:657-1103(-)
MWCASGTTNVLYPPLCKNYPIRYNLISTRNSVPQSGKPQITASSKKSLSHTSKPAIYIFSYKLFLLMSIPVYNVLPSPFYKIPSVYCMKARRSRQTLIDTTLSNTWQVNNLAAIVLLAGTSRCLDIELITRRSTNTICDKPVLHCPGN